MLNLRELDKELAVMDIHEDKVAEITERLQQVRPEPKAASVVIVVHED